MTADSTNGRYAGDASRDRKRAKRCPYDYAELIVRAGFTCCPTCGKTAAEMAQAVIR